MGFLSGSTTFERFQVIEDPTATFGDAHLELLQQFRIGAFKTNLYEQPNVGFTAGTHLFDTDFDHAKNILGDAMHFGVRIDSCQIPGPIKKAWLQMELAPMLADKPGGRPTKVQRQEAKDAVDARCSDEAQKGSFHRMSETSVLWDAVTETVFIGSTSEKVNDQCVDLLERAFGIQLAKVTTGKLCFQLAESNGWEKALDHLQPTNFLPDFGPAEITWWNGEANNFDYLGNEFLLWLWWYWQNQSDTIVLSDGSEVSGMFARTLSLDCPHGEYGKETISSDSPVMLPEAAMAVRMGKLPRKAGLTLVRDGEQYDLNLQAEMFSFGSARIRQLGNDTEPQDQLDRIESVRQLCETVDLLLASFCEHRLNPEWTQESQKMTQWLKTNTPAKRRKTAA